MALVTHFQESGARSEVVALQGRQRAPGRRHDVDRRLAYALLAQAGAAHARQAAPKPASGFVSVAFIAQDVAPRSIAEF
jgi:hypothetical protein